jgi:hypothetical protein
MPDFLNLPGLTTSSNGSGPEMSEFIQQTDEARAVPCPGNVAKFWVEPETEAAEEEQEKLYEEKGEAEAREPYKVAAELSHEADKAATESDEKNAEAKAARQRHERDKKVLRRYVRRRTDAKFMYWLRWVLFLLGDIAGIGGAGLMLGEYPANAVVQALSAAVSAVTLGGVGREVRCIVAARGRQKAPGELSDAERDYAFLFTGPIGVEGIIKILLLISLTGLALIAGGIFALRDAAEGQTVALAFGCFALALGLASFYNSYDATCEVAEYIDTGAAELKKLDKAARKASQNPVIARRAGAIADAKSARATNKAAGEAAARGLRRRLYRLLNENPGVAGNGPATGRTNGHRTNRRRRGGDS